MKEDLVTDALDETIRTALFRKFVRYIRKHGSMSWGDFQSTFLWFRLKERYDIPERHISDMRELWSRAVDIAGRQNR